MILEDSWCQRCCPLQAKVRSTDILASTRAKLGLVSLAKEQPKARNKPQSRGRIGQGRTGCNGILNCLAISYLNQLMVLEARQGELPLSENSRSSAKLPTLGTCMLTLQHAKSEASHTLEMEGARALAHAELSHRACL
jgi:hypothetical protein